MVLLSNVVIKSARPNDIPQIVALSYASFYENGLEGLGATPNFDKTVISVTDIVTNHMALVKRNEENDDLIDGIFLLKESTTWWSTDPVLYSVILFIKQDKRSFKLARALLERGKEYAIMESRPLVLDLFAQKDVEKKRKLLKYTGFTECGSLFIFNPSGSSE